MISQALTISGKRDLKFPATHTSRKWKWRLGDFYYSFSTSLYYSVFFPSSPSSIAFIMFLKINTNFCPQGTENLTETARDTCYPHLIRFF